MTSRRQPGIVAPGLTGTARSPASRCSPQATATLCDPSPLPHVGPGLGWGRTRATEEDETVSGSELCPETDSQGRPPGRPHAAEGAEPGGQGRKERACGVSRDVCLLLGRLGPCLLASEN